LAAIRFAQAQNPSAIIIDSMSHEHEGPGGLLDTHDKELDRICGPNASDARRHAMGFTAWAKPKAQRRQFLTGMLESDAAIIACFRAQEKTTMRKNDKGKGVPTNIGWQAIADPKFVYEMAVCALFKPGAKGVPDWTPEKPDERTFVKVPGWAEKIFAPNQQLTEAHGEALAQWAKGGAARPKTSNTDLDALREEGEHAASLGMSFLAAFWQRQDRKTQNLLAGLKDEKWKPMAIKADAKIEEDEPELEGVEL